MRIKDYTHFKKKQTQNNTFLEVWTLMCWLYFSTFDLKKVEGTNMASKH